MYVPSTTGSELVTASNADQTFYTSMQISRTEQNTQKQFLKDNESARVVGQHDYVARTNYLELDLEKETYDTTEHTSGTLSKVEAIPQF